MGSGFHPTRWEFDQPESGSLLPDSGLLALLEAPRVTVFGCLPGDPTTADGLPELLTGAWLPRPTGE